MKVAMKNAKTGDMKEVKIGWSWTLFLFSGIFIPLVMRKLYRWLVWFIGCFVLAFGINMLAPEAIANLITRIMGLINIGISIYLGIKGNQITAKNYLKIGYDFIDNESDAVKLAKSKWWIL